MKKEVLKKKKIPSTSGVYFFLGKKKEILYIGKATSLKQRITSYFDTDIVEKRSVLIEKMVTEAQTMEWTTTDSVLEAMLLETNLIRTHKPFYNTRSKDDKSYNHVVITKDTFPQVLVVRGKDVVSMDESQYTAVYGPFPSGTLFKEALKIMRKLFQFYDVSITVSQEENMKERVSKIKRGKIDFNRQIGLYPESCTPKVYARTIRHIQLFFEGKKTTIIQELEKEMFQYAKKEEFEKANILKKKIFALKHIQDVSLISDDTKVYVDEKSFRIEAYDIAHMGGQNMVGVMTVCKGDEVDRSAYRKFHVRECKDANDPRALSEILERRLAHTEWEYPDLIVVDGSTAQRNALLKVLKKHSKTIPVVGVVKNEKHTPVRIIGPQKLIITHKKTILYANAESHRFAIMFHKQKRNKQFLAQ